MLFWVFFFSPVFEGEDVWDKFSDSFQDYLIP